MDYSIIDIFTVENLAVAFSIAFVIFNARGRIISWPLGILGSALYVFVFFTARLYADMGLQVFYVLMGFYGWIQWSRSGVSDEVFRADRIGKKKLVILVLIGGVLSPGLGFFLNHFTDADLPYWDALTTVYSLIATWMMAKRYLENWLVWIVIDLLCIFIYFYKGLNATSILFFVYTGMAIYGYIEWRSKLILPEEHA